MAEFTWSYSSLKQYQNCPKQYHHIRVLKDYQSKETEATIYGKDVHEALELYIKEDKPLPKNYKRFQPYVDKLKSMEGTKYPEYQMALTYNKEPCDFESEDRWVRGIVDLLIIDGDYAFIVDYKTGSNKYPDPKQLRLMSLMAFTHFPDIQKVKAALLFVAHNSIVSEEYFRKDMDKSWGMFEQTLKRLELSYDNDKWQANPTPLCKWCPVESCEFNRS